MIFTHRNLVGEGRNLHLVSVQAFLSPAWGRMKLSRGGQKSGSTEVSPATAGISLNMKLYIYNSTTAMT